MNWFQSSSFGRAGSIHFLRNVRAQGNGFIGAQAQMAFNKRVNNGLNMRCFEATGAGAVLLTYGAINNGVQYSVTVDELCLRYRDEKTLLELIASPLQDPIRWRRIGDASRHQVMATRIYQHRSACTLAIDRRSAKLVLARFAGYFCALLVVHLNVYV